MRARRQNGHAPASDLGGEEPFVHDQRVGLADVAAERVMAVEAHLVARRAGDRPAAEKEPTAEHMRFVVQFDRPSGVGE